MRKKRGKGRNSAKINKFPAKILIVVLIALSILLIIKAAGTPTLKGKAVYIRECVDNVDNDGDGKTDLDDAGCKNKNDDTESNCKDGTCSNDEGLVSCPEDCTLNECRDSDNGYYTEKKGTITGRFNNKYFSSTDYCFNEDMVVEYTCINGEPKKVAAPCATSVTSICKEGKCV